MHPNRQTRAVGPHAHCLPVTLSCIFDRFAQVRFHVCAGRRTVPCGEAGSVFLCDAKTRFTVL